MRNAQVTLNDTYLYAPCDGVVVKKTVNVGEALSPGQTILTVTQGDRVCVNANFKETQLTHVRGGQKADMEVDSFPGKRAVGAPARCTCLLIDCCRGGCAEAGSFSLADPCWAGAGGDQGGAGHHHHQCRPPDDGRQSRLHHG